jgi:glycosyltransferase involved in cell wall biosynthesis
LYPSVFDCGGAVVLEAMSLGLTVVALNWGGPGDYLASGAGVLVEPVGRRQSVAELAKVVRSLTPSKRRELGETAQRTIVDHYTWPAKARQILGVYHQLSGGETGSESSVDAGSATLASNTNPTSAA